MFWLPKTPMAPLRIGVQNFVEAKVVLDALASFDAFEVQHGLKPDSGFGGLQWLDESEDEWQDYSPEIFEDHEMLFCEACSRARSFDDATLEQVRRFQAALDAAAGQRA